MRTLRADVAEAFFVPRTRDEEGWSAVGPKGACAKEGGRAYHGAMQVHQESLGSCGRPCPGKDCPRCQGDARFHRHGSYERCRAPDGKRTAKVQVYICSICRRTWSVIPPGMMPYRRLEVARFEQLADEQCGLLDEGARPPPATVKETECFERALRALHPRLAMLRALLGQLLPVLDDTDWAGFWRALRVLGPAMDTFLRLARDFKTSLLRCYKSLRPFWHREKAPV